MKLPFITCFFAILALSQQACSSDPSSDDNENNDNTSKNIQIEPSQASAGTIIEMKGDVLETNSGNITVLLGNTPLNIIENDDNDVVYVQIPKNETGNLSITVNGKKETISSFSVIPTSVYAYGEIIGTDSLGMFQVSLTDYSLTKVATLKYKISELFVNPHTRQIIGYHANELNNQNEASITLFDPQTKSVKYIKNESLTNLAAMFAYVPTESDFWGFIDKGNGFSPVSIDSDFNLDNSSYSIPLSIPSSVVGTTKSDKISSFINDNGEYKYVAFNPENATASDQTIPISQGYDKITLDPFSDMIYCLRSSFGVDRFDPNRPTEAVVPINIETSGMNLPLDICFVADKGQIIILDNQITAGDLTAKFIIYDTNTETTTTEPIDSKISLLRFVAL